MLFLSDVSATLWAWSCSPWTESELNKEKQINKKDIKRIRKYTDWQKRTPIPHGGFVAPHNGPPKLVTFRYFPMYVVIRNLACLAQPCICTRRPFKRFQHHIYRNCADCERLAVYLDEICEEVPTLEWCVPERTWRWRLPQPHGSFVGDSNLHVSESASGTPERLSGSYFYLHWRPIMALHETESERTREICPRWQKYKQKNSLSKWGKGTEGTRFMRTAKQRMTFAS